MVHYIHSRNPYSEALRKQLEAIERTPGTCIFMDVNRSTDLKYTGGLSEWGRKLNNTFNILLYSNHLEKFIIKGIGDEMMLYIPDEELKKRSTDNNHYAMLENIYAALFLICNDRNQKMFLECKVSMHHCTEAYNITFFERANDYYGKDIDLTARYMSKAIKNRIVISEAYYNKVKEDLSGMGLKTKHGCLETLSRRRTAKFKGVPDLKDYRVIDVGF